MPDIKEIDKTTDLTDTHFYKYGWELELDGAPYQLVSIPGYYHTIGGRLGNNDLYAHPLGESPTVNNLIQFNGHAPCWGITFEQVNYRKSKWGSTSIEGTGSCWITRNGKKFFPVPGRSMDYCLAKAQSLLVELKEGALNISERDWAQNMRGRKVYWHQHPGVVDRIHPEDGEVYISSEDPAGFPSPVYLTRGIHEHNERQIKTSITDTHIWWFRD